MDDRAHRPTCSRQLAATYDVAGTSDQPCQQPVFGGSQRDGRPARDEGVLRGIERQPVVGSPNLLRSTGQSGQPDHELGKFKRFGQVIVGAGLETGDLVMQPIARGQHQHRSSDAGCTQRQADIPTVGVRQTDIQYHHIGCCLCEQRERLPSVVGDDQTVSGLRQGPYQDRAERGIVLANGHSQHGPQASQQDKPLEFGAFRLLAGPSTHAQTMTTATDVRVRKRPMSNKVPEVTVYFWVIKILCTTVGESFADYINETLGFGLTNTTLVFSAGLVVVMIVQFRVKRYLPPIYWLVVVLVSVVGTLLTDNLTDGHHVPLWISTTVFSLLLATVFGIWYARERTLSIHSIITTPREAFYWLTVLVTFALGTAVGDWTLELTGWGPGPSVLLPLGLIIATAIAWRRGLNPVLSFWIAFILTRPLGANIGDFLGSARPDGGLGLGTLWTSALFLGTILIIVVFLSLTHRDQIGRDSNRQVTSMEVSR